MLPVPERLEDRVGEPQVEDLDEPHLSEEVVDPVELLLVDVLVHLVVQLLRRGEVVSERLLHHHPRVLGEPGAGKSLDHGAEQERRNLEVEDRAARLAQDLGQMPEGRGVTEVSVF